MPNINRGGFITDCSGQFSVVFFNIAVATAILAVVVVPCSYAQSNRDQATAQPATRATGRLLLGEERLFGEEEIVIDATDQSDIGEIAEGLMARDGLQQPASSCAGINIGAHFAAGAKEGKLLTLTLTSDLLSLGLATTVALGETGRRTLKLAVRFPKKG